MILRKAVSPLNKTYGDFSLPYLYYCQKGSQSFPLTYKNMEVSIYAINISEQQYFEIEKQLIDSNTKLEAESSSNEQLKEQLKELGKIFFFFSLLSSVF